MKSLLLYVPGVFSVLGMILSSTIHFYQSKGEPENSKRSFQIYKKTLPKIGNVFLMVFPLVFCFLWMRFPINSLLKALSESNKIGAMEIRFLYTSFLTSLISCWGTAGAVAGFLSFFQLNLTKGKRLTLLIICLVPLILMILLLFTTSIGDLLIIIKLGCLFSSLCWLVNAPSIILGKHWFQLALILTDKITLALKGKSE